MPYNIDTLKAELHEALFLDLDEFRLETAGEDPVSKFIGLYLRGTFQPIHSTILGKPLGYEALMRPSIDALFSFQTSSSKHQPVP